MGQIVYRDRRAYRISNGRIQVTVLYGGGHIAEIRHLGKDVNPLWTPPWASIEPNSYDPTVHTIYGDNAESRLLAGIMGHNVCLDIFGGPSEEEAASGLTVHGEASVADYEISGSETELVMKTELWQAGLRLERRIALDRDMARIREWVTNVTGTDRPVGWTQHVTMGPPFIEPGVTEFGIPATKSKVIEVDFTEGKGHQETGAEFEWPHCPRRGGGSIDLRVYPPEAVSAGYTAHLMDPERDYALFVAWHPGIKLAFGYAWARKDFPWLGRWEENHSRTGPPWNGETLTCGMEFGVSPMPETRRQMVERGSLFGVPGFRWIPARGTVSVDYCAFVRETDTLPAMVDVA
jgi:hypothetical protein